MNKDKCSAKCILDGQQDFFAVTLQNINTAVQNQIITSCSL